MADDEATGNGWDGVFDDHPLLVLLNSPPTHMTVISRSTTHPILINPDHQSAKVSPLGKDAFREHPYPCLRGGV